MCPEAWRLTGQCRGWGRWHTCPCACPLPPAPGCMVAVAALPGADSVEASVLLLLWVQPSVSLETPCLRPGEGLVDRWVPDGPGGDCSHVVVRAYAPVMTSAAPECRDPFRDLRTYLASHRVSLPKSENIFPNKQEISFTCKKKKKWA